MDLVDTPVGALGVNAGGLSKLALSVETIIKFVPVNISFVKSKGNDDAESLLGRVHWQGI